MEFYVRCLRFVNKVDDLELVKTEFVTYYMWFRRNKIVFEEATRLDENLIEMAFKVMKDFDEGLWLIYCPHLLGYYGGCVEELEEVEPSVAM